MKPERLLARLRRGDITNVRFDDFRSLVEAIGFELLRSSGSHHIYRHPRADALLSIQDARGQAKPYQIRQFLRTIADYELAAEETW